MKIKPSIFFYCSILLIVCVVSIPLLAQIVSHTDSIDTVKHYISEILKGESIEIHSDSYDKNQLISIEEIIALTNKARLEADPNLLPLVANEMLHNSAQAKVDDMIEKNYFEHETPEGYSLEYFVDNAHYEYISIAENLASGDFASAHELVDAWMSSPGHRENILRPEMRDLGVAIVYSNFQGNMQYVAVQHFGRPKSDCQEASITLQSRIQEDEATIQKLATTIALQQEIIENKNSTTNEKTNALNTYNTLVDQYNALSKQIQYNIEFYNKQVRAFNACIAT